MRVRAVPAEERHVDWRVCRTDGFIYVPRAGAGLSRFI